MSVILLQEVGVAYHSEVVCVSIKSLSRHRRSGPLKQIQKIGVMYFAIAKHKGNFLVVWPT